MAKYNPRGIYIEMYRKFYNIPSQSMYIYTHTHIYTHICTDEAQKAETVRLSAVVLRSLAF